MYRYECIISDADKSIFNKTISEIAGCYSEVEEEQTEKNGVISKLLIIHTKKDSFEVLIEYNQENSQVTVLSEEYLFDFFKGKEVVNIRKMSRVSGKNVGDFLPTIIFLIFNIAICILGVPLYFVNAAKFIGWAALTAIYIVSYIAVFQKRDMNIFQIVKTWLGGWIFIIGFPIFMIVRICAEPLMFFFLFMWVYMVIPPIILSMIVIAVIENENLHKTD